MSDMKTLTPAPLPQCGRGEIERLLGMYCDLTWAQYEDLLAISSGQSPHMNGARRQALGEMLNEHLLLTWAGQQALNRAIGLVSGAWTPLVREKRIVNHARVAMLARARYDGGHWMRSVHVKVVDILWHRPGLTYKHLCQIYGYQTIQELLERQMVTGRAVLGSAFRLAVEGEKFVYWGFRMEVEK